MASNKFAKIVNIVIKNRYPFGIGRLTSSSEDNGNGNLN